MSVCEPDPAGFKFYHLSVWFEVKFGGGLLKLFHPLCVIIHQYHQEPNIPSLPPPFMLSPKSSVFVSSDQLTFLIRLLHVDRFQFNCKVMIWSRIFILGQHPQSMLRLKPLNPWALERSQSLPDGIFIAKSLKQTRETERYQFCQAERSKIIHIQIQIIENVDEDSTKTSSGRLTWLFRVSPIGPGCHWLWSSCSRAGRGGNALPSGSTDHWSDWLHTEAPEGCVCTASPACKQQSPHCFPMVCVCAPSLWLAAMVTAQRHEVTMVLRPPRRCHPQRPVALCRSPGALSRSYPAWPSVQRGDATHTLKHKESQSVRHGPDWFTNQLTQQSANNSTCFYS